MPKKPCQFCGVPIPSGWSDHRCPEMEAALEDLKAAAGTEEAAGTEDNDADSASTKDFPLGKGK